MPNQTITVPIAQQKTVACPSCQTALHFALISKVCPHLYCSLCHNAYAEPKAEALAQSIWWQRRAVREQHAIQSHAPVCECGGLFLFNAHPHCTHCGRPLTLAFPIDAKGRLRYSELVVFPGTKLYYDNGTINLYQFA